MGALPNVQPRKSFKPDQYGRDPGSPSERLRKRTDYKKQTGYSQLFHAMFVDMRRLSRGVSCHNLILAIWALSDRSKAGDGWTDGKTIEEWSELSYHTETKEFSRNRDYLKSRKMADVRVTQDIRAQSKALYAFRLRPEEWQALEDYAAWIKKQKPEPETPEPDNPDDPAQQDEVKKGNWRMSKPVTVARGKTSKPFTPDCGVARIRFATPAATPEGVDISFFSVVQAGDLIVTPTVTLTYGAEKAKGDRNTRVRSGPEDMDVLGTSPRVRQEKKGTKGESHPRGAELIQIFDPLLEKSASQLLCFESSSKILKLACEAIGDTPRNELISFLNKPGGRGSRSVQLKAIPGICNDVREVWQKERHAPRVATQAEIDAAIAKERAAREARRKR